MVFKVIPNRYVKCQIDFVKSLFKNNKPNFNPNAMVVKLINVYPWINLFQMNLKIFVNILLIFEVIFSNFIQRNSTVLN